VSALDRKLWRDLRRLRGQIVTIALVVAFPQLALWLPNLMKGT
jgi:hypothetical protein